MRFVFPVLAAGALLASPAHADVVAKSELGFVSRNVVEVAAKPDAVWAILVAPSRWWNSEHTYSGNSANLTLDPQAGGCFCEKLPAPAGAPVWQRAGSVEHMRVINVEPGRALRMTGALGPLQAEAVQGVLTITLKPTEKGTRILFEYVVGGYMRFTVDQIAPPVDKVLLEQIGRLANTLDPASAGKALLPDGPRPLPKAGTTPAEPLVGPPAPLPSEQPALSEEASEPAEPDPVPEAPELPAAVPAAEPEPAAETAIDAVLPRPRGPARLEAVEIDPSEATVPPSLVAPANAYVERDLIVRPWRNGIGFFPADGEVPLAVEFASPGLQERLAADLAAARKLPENKGKTAFCACTGRVSEKDGKAVFSIIAGQLVMR